MTAASPNPPPSPRVQAETGRKLPLQNKLEEFFGVIAIGLEATGDSFGATVVNRRAPDLARAWARLARENPAVKRVLEAMLTGGAWGEVAMVSLSVAIPILWHRGIVPDDLGVPFAYGVVPESEEVQRAMAGQSGAIVPEPPAEESDEEPEEAPEAANNGEPSGAPAAPKVETREADGVETQRAPGPTPSGGRIPGRSSSR